MAAPREADGFHPGAAPYGNFINYYSFNPPEKRINFLPTNLLNIISYMRKKKIVTVLDIGCNAGDLTRAIYKHLTEAQQADETDSTTMIPSDTLHEKHNSHDVTALDLPEFDSPVQVNVLGCDIDETLIVRANESNTHPENITFQHFDFMCSTIRNDLVSPFLSNHSATDNQFDLVCCFSITMWVHLIHGDAGLYKFLREASAMSRFLLVEPQPWKCYKSAVRRVKKVGIDNPWKFKELEIRGNVDEEIRNYLMSDCQMELIQTLGETHWDRKLLLFENVGSKQSLNE